LEGCEVGWDDGIVFGCWDGCEDGWIEGCLDGWEEGNILALKKGSCVFRLSVVA
jgi:hypothetical protein